MLAWKGLSNLASLTCILDSFVFFLFLGQNDDELTCNQNDEILVLEDLGDGWLKVRKGQSEGYVPESYVQYRA